MTVHQTGEYAMQMLGDHLVEIRKEDGTTYRAALAENGAVSLCTCAGHLRFWHCKHQGLVVQALQGEGIPFPGGGVRRIQPGVGLVSEGKPDPFARFERAGAVR